MSRSSLLALLLGLLFVSCAETVAEPVAIASPTATARPSTPAPSPTARGTPVSAITAAPTVAATAARPAPAAPTPPATPSRAGCDPSYPTVCIPPAPPDLDCPQIPFRRFTVVGADPHRLDADCDGIGCES